MVSLIALYIGAKPATKRMSFGWSRAGNYLIVQWLYCYSTVCFIVRVLCYHIVSVCYVITLSQYCYYIVTVLLLHCHSTIITLSRYCYYIVTVQLFHCHSTVITLSQYCYYIVTVLCYYIVTVLCYYVNKVVCNILL